MTGKPDTAQRIVRMPAHTYVEARTAHGILAGQSGEHGCVTEAQILGMMRHVRFCKDYGQRRQHKVEVLLEPADGLCRLEDVQELWWPYELDWRVGAAEWNLREPIDIGCMILDEVPVAMAILEVLEPLLGEGATVLDPACSHGLCLKMLAAARPDLRLIARDLSPGMAELTRRALAGADVGLGDARALGPLEVDAVVLRAASQRVMSRDDALAAITAALGALRPGGYLVLHSLYPLLVNSTDLEPLGELLRRVHRLGDTLRPFYLLRRDHRRTASSPEPTGYVL